MTDSVQRQRDASDLVPDEGSNANVIRVEFDPTETRTITSNIRDAYLNDARPWIIGFSGGKDSTALMQMVYYAIASIPETKRETTVYVLASDTRVETPSVSKRVRNELAQIQLAAESDGLPISTHLVYPKLNETFWVNLIGRGYPSPTSHFRWCTERLKINPVSHFIQRVVNRSGDVTILLGARKSESSTRAQTMRRHEVTGNQYRPHSTLRRAWVYTPIEDLDSDDVWEYLIEVPNPWNGDNQSLVALYRQASGECPLVVDTSTPSCGHSRFGCWTCTVIDRDKSVKSLIDAGEDHLKPLLELRDYLREVRDAPGARYDLRRNGAIPFRRGTNERLTNTGPFKHVTRTDLLRRVLIAQKESRVTLIEGDELRIIQEIWDQEESNHPSKPAVPTDAVRRIWKYVHGDEPMPGQRDMPELQDDEDNLLKTACERHGVPFEMMRRLRATEEEYGHLKRRHGLPEQMREIVKEAIAQADVGLDENGDI